MCLDALFLLPVYVEETCLVLWVISVAHKDASADLLKNQIGYGMPCVAVPIVNADDANH